MAVTLYKEDELAVALGFESTACFWKWLQDAGIFYRGKLGVLYPVAEFGVLKPISVKWVGAKRVIFFKQLAVEYLVHCKKIERLKI